MKARENVSYGNRNRCVDIIRGILIIMMVVGHSGSPFIIERFIYLFHLSAFMILSGYTYSENNSESITACIFYIKRRVFRLYLPYCFVNLVCVFIHNNLYSLGLYQYSYTCIDILKKAIKTFLFAGTEQLIGALWYIRILFIVSIGWCFVSYVSKIIARNFNIKYYHIMTIYAIGMLLIGYLMNIFHINLDLNIPCVFTYSFMWAIGVWLKKINLLDRLNKYTWGGVVCFIFLLVITIGTDLTGATGSNDYGSLIVMLLVTVCGWGVCCLMANIISKTRIVGLICYIGQRTAWIMYGHFWAFKLVIILQIYVYGLNKKVLSVFPIYRCVGYWWILYTIVGIIIPLLLQHLYVVMKKWIDAIKN